MVEEARQLCRAEWGDFPELVDINQDRQDWIFRFKNHPDDTKPSTVARGEHRRLLIQGGGHSLEGAYFLPDSLTANQLGDHLAIRFGLQTPEPCTRPADGAAANASTPPSGIDRFAMGCVIENLCRSIQKDFRLPISDQTLPELRDAYRAKLPRAFARIRWFPAPTLILAGEGIGKSTTHLPLLAGEALDEAMSQGSDQTRQRFASFAFRSRRQAEHKADEFGRQGYKVVMVRSFWDHYQRACEALGERPMSRDDFDDMRPGAVLEEIGVAQPTLFEHLEGVRRSLWSGGARFNGGLTLLLMTHKLAALWSSGTLLTRAWHHPEFDPDSPPEEHERLAKELVLSRVLFDDPEPDDFVHLLDAYTYDFIQSQQEGCPGYRPRPRRERLGIFQSLGKGLPRKLVGDFEAFDELMRLDLDTLEAVEVDYEAIPFGYERTPSGIYRRQNGRRYYVGPKPWLSGTMAHLTFVTTEALVTDVIEKALPKKKGSRPIRLDLRDVPGVYPIKVPTFLDRRAAANQEGKERVSALAREILGSGENGIVISDGTRGVEGVLSFQSAKGVNGLEEKDVYVVVTNLAPEKYAELNVLGQWLGIQDVIQLHYQDQIDQAVGRNGGFRHSSNETKTVLVTSQRLWINLLSKLWTGAGRTQLYGVDQKPWGPPP